MPLTPLLMIYSSQTCTLFGPSILSSCWLLETPEACTTHVQFDGTVWVFYLHGSNHPSPGPLSHFLGLPLPLPLQYRPLLSGLTTFLVFCLVPTMCPKSVKSLLIHAFILNFKGCHVGT